MLKYVLLTGLYLLACTTIAIVFNMVTKKGDWQYRERKKESGSYVIIRNRWDKIALALCIIMVILAFVYHFFTIDSILKWTIPFVYLTFLWSIFLVVSSYFNKTYVQPEDSELSFRSAIVIPVYNEDQVLFKMVLESISKQTHLAEYVYVVEDGSLEENKVEAIFNEWAETYPHKTAYKYVANNGKREAQAVAFEMLRDEVDVFITIDSDTILDERAVEEGLYPFFNENVMSVGGVLLDYNNKDNFLTRVVGVSFVSAFSNGRASSSAWNSVGVNHGCLAFYRREVIEENLDHYLNQIVFKQKAKFGDDRMLTQYASLMGDTVYQESSIGYTVNPTKLSHLVRQRTRWWRSFWWGGVWFLKEQSIFSMAWWFQLVHFISWGLYTPIFFLVYIFFPIVNMTIPIIVILYMIFMGYIRNVRVLRFDRPDMSKTKQVLYYLVFSPLSTILNILICTILQTYALLTVWKVANWGTREDVEVAISLEDEQATQSVIS